MQKKVEEAELLKTNLSDKEIAEARDKNGKPIYVDKEGNQITTADALNSQRMQAFKDVIGKDDLLASSMAYSAVREFSSIEDIEKKLEISLKKIMNTIN